MKRKLPLAATALALAAMVGLALPAQAAPARAHATGSLQPPVHVLRLGRSVGSPTAGRLIGGSHLDETPYLRVVSCYLPGDARWGLGPLVSLIDRGARMVRHKFPDAVLSVGHLSRPGGGDIDRHASHESGRDADVGFYIRSQTGKPLYADHFVPFRGDGTAPSWPGAYFDDAKNWAFVASLVTEPPARVTYIFVASPLRARLLAYAQRVGAPIATRSRAAELMAQPRGSLPHDDHFHVRIGCPAGMTGCIEFPTISRAKAARLRHALPVASGAHGSSPARSAPGAGAIAQRPPPPPPRDDRPDQHPPPAHSESATDPDPHGQEAAPPAAVGAPIDDAIDDVDGPLSQRDLGGPLRVSFVTALR